MPAWWLWMFVVTLVFGIGYLIAYPGLGNFKGLLGWSQFPNMRKRLKRPESSTSPCLKPIWKCRSLSW
ncbi:MAG: cbb3-type cytochrome c oxidase N-terminal domain-containing protein [Porticoccaceae bacterium]